MSVTTGQAVTLLENVLFEQPSIATANATTWVANSGIAGQNTVSGLAAAMAATNEGQIAQQVVRYYMGALGRVPAGSEIQFYVTYAEQGLTAAQLTQGSGVVPVSTWSNIANFFANSPEFSHDYGLSSPGAVNSSNEGLVITAFYSNVLNRAPQASEIAFYENALNTGTSVQTLIQYFTNSPEYQNQVDGGLATALGSYGASVANGTTPATIPFFMPGQVITDALGSSALTVSGTAKSTIVTVTGTPAQAAQSAVTAVTGVIGVSAVAAATGVQGVAAVAAVTPVAAQAAQSAVTDGAVTINDANSTATGGGTITTVTLASSGAGSSINDNSLANLTLSGTTGTLAITNSNSAAISAHASTLNLTLDGLSAAANTITDTNNEIATLAVTTANHDSTLAGFADTQLTTLTVSGTNKLTLNSINASLTSLTVSGGAGFSDGATTHAGGLAALGSGLTLSDSSSGSFAAAINDTSQSFTGGSGADTILVNALADATHAVTAGSSTNNEIIFEGGAYALTSASSGKFVNFQAVGVAGNVTGTIDLSVIDATASRLEVQGTASVTFTKAAAGAALLIDPSAGASVRVSYADSNGASDSAGITLSSAVASLSLQDAAGVGIATVTLTNNLGPGETNVSAAHLISTLTDSGLATLNVGGAAGLAISSLTVTGSAFTLNNTSPNGNGVVITGLTGTALTSLGFTGNGVSSIGSLTSAAASFAVTNGGTALESIGTLSDNSLTSLALAANVALGQTSTASTANGLQDGSAAGVTISGAGDNAHVTVNLTTGAAAGLTDTVTLGNGNNVVVDNSAVGTVNVTLGTGANLVELGGGSLDTTALYNVTLATRTATPPNVIYVGAAGTNYASAPNIVITGATAGDVIAFGNDSSSSNAALTATTASSVATLEAAATSAHKVVYGVIGGNTYIVETSTGFLGATDTAVIEVIGVQTLTASTGYVTLGSTAAAAPSGGLTGAGFTILAGTATSLTLGSGPNVVTLVGPTAGVTDTFTSIAATGALIINYQATAASTGTDTIQMSGSAGAATSNITSLIVNDTSAGSAGVTIGAFTDNTLTSATYNNSAATGATVSQSSLTSSSLNSINLTGGVSGQATNVYFISAALSTSGGVTVNDSNLGTGSTTMGLTLAGGPNLLTLAMSGPGTLATGALTDNNLASLSITGSGTGSVNVGALSDSLAGAFTVTDSSTSTGASVIVLTGLSAATMLTVNDSAAGSLTDSSAYSDASLAKLTLNNTGSGALTIGSGGIQANALTNLTITGSGSGSITTGTLSDTGSAAVTLTDSYASSGAVTLPLGGISAATGITIADTGTGSLSVGAITDNALTALTITGSGAVTVGAITDALAGAVTFTNNSSSTTAATWTVASLPSATSVTFADGAAAAWTIGAFTDSSAATLTFANTGSALLTASGVTDSAAAATLALAGSGTGTETIALTDAGATSLTITDSSTSTGANTVTPTLTGGPAAVTVTDSATGALTVAAFSDANLTSATLTNSGSGVLTLGSSAAGGIAGTAVLTTLTFGGIGSISTWVAATDSAGTLTVTDSDSGAVTVNVLNLGTAATNTNTLVLTNSNTGSGSLTIAGGTTYLTGLTLSNAGTGLNAVTLSDSASGAVTVSLSGTGSESLNFTDTTGTVALTQSGSANIVLTLSGGSVAGDQVTLGGGAGDAITLSSGHAVGIAMAFSAAPGSNANVSPVPGTADKITNFLTDTALVRGDTLQLGAAGSSVTALLTTADANSGGNVLWTVSAGGMMTKQGASVQNFVDDVQSITQAGGTASTSGVAGFSDGTNTWIAYNDHAHHVAVIELVGVVAIGIESGASHVAGFVHIV